MSDTERALREEIQRMKEDRRKDDDRKYAEIFEKLNCIQESQAESCTHQETTSLHIEGIKERLEAGDERMSNIEEKQEEHADECEEREKRLASLEHDHAITKWIVRSLCGIGLTSAAAWVASLGGVKH